MSPERPTGEGATPDYYEIETSAERQMVQAVVRHGLNALPNSDESGRVFERDAERPTVKESLNSEVKLTHPDYLYTEPVSELDRAKRKITSIVYRWPHLKRTGEYVTENGELSMSVDEEQPVENGTTPEVVRMTYEETQKQRIKAVEDLEQLFELPGVSGSSVVVTRPEAKEPNREIHNVQGFTMKPIGNVVIKYFDADRQETVEQWIMGIGAPDGCDIKFL